MRRLSLCCGNASKENMKRWFGANKLQEIINEAHACKMTQVTSTMLDFLLDVTGTGTRYSCCQPAQKSGKLYSTSPSCPWNCGKAGWKTDCIGTNYEAHCAALDPAPAQMLLAKLLHLNKSANN